MYIELIDLLRCPRQHADSWLVAAFDSMDGRFVVTGKLGCPICSSSYRITGGTADLRTDEQRERPGPDEPATVTDATEEAAVRAAALLGLTRPNSLVVLCGDSAILSERVSDLAEARVIALNPTHPPVETERVAVVRTGDRFPLPPASVDGIVLDQSAGPALAVDAARVLRQGGRVVAPAATVLGASFRELARDEREVVAESVGELISLSR